MARFQPSDTVFNRTRARVLRHLSGATGEKYRKKHQAFLQMDCERQFTAALQTVADKVCIDLGANVGHYTEMLAAQAARVIAFEPDPWTADRLRANTAHLSNIEVIEAAASTQDGPLTMYRSHDYSQDPGKHSESTSAFSEKLNVDSANTITVKQVDFPAFLNALEGPVGILKIDIEGAEVQLLEALLDHPALSRVEWIFCETHENQLPQMLERYQALRKRTARISHPKINLDWW